MNVVIKSTADKKKALEAINEAKDSKALKGLTSLGVAFKKIANTLILM